MGKVPVVYFPSFIPIVLFGKDKTVRGTGRYRIMDLIYIRYTLSSGWSSGTRNCLKRLGDMPVTLRNCALRCAGLE